MVFHPPEEDVSISTNWLTVTAAIYLHVCEERVLWSSFANEGGGALGNSCTGRGQEQQSWRMASGYYYQEHGFWKRGGVLIPKAIRKHCLVESKRGLGWFVCVTAEGCPSRADVVFRGFCRCVWSRRIFWTEESYRQECQGQEKSCRGMT